MSLCYRPDDHLLSEKRCGRALASRHGVAEAPIRRPRWSRTNELGTRTWYEIEPDVQAELRKYPRKWAALTSTKLLAIADTSTEAYKAGRALGVESPILYLVPDNRAGYSYF